MNIFEDIVNDKNVDLNDVDMHFFICKFISTCTKKTVFNLTYGDPRLVVPLLVFAMSDSKMSDSEQYSAIAKKICHSDTYQKIMDKRRSTQPSLNTRAEYTAESFEALQNKLDKGQPGWKKGDPHVIDISKLELFDLTDPDVVKKTCSK